MMALSRSQRPMTSTAILENPLLNELYDMPWKFRRGATALTARVEQETGMAASAAFLQFYECRTGQTGRSLEPLGPDSSISAQTVIGSSVRRFPDYQCLTADHPTALAKRARRQFKIPPVELYGISGEVVISLNHDIPIVARKSDAAFGVMEKVGSQIYTILNIRGGERILTENQIAVPPIYFFNDHYGANNYAHWLLDWVPRLKFLVEDKGLSRHSLLFGMPPNAAQRETFEALKIDPSRIIAVRKATLNASIAFSTPEVVGCTTSGRSLRRPAQACAPWALEFVRSLFLNSKALRAGRRIWVDRKGTRRLLLSDETRELLDRLGFEQIFLEGMPVRDQAQLFNDCAVIVSAHGAGLSNLVFCEPGTKVLEIFPENYSTSNFFALSSAMELDYLCAVGKSIKSPLGDHLRDYDIEVDPGIIDRFFGHFDIAA